MTLEELENSLPNGLHDAEVNKITIDYEHRRATVDLAVWVGNMDDPPHRREAYKAAQVQIPGLLFVVMEAPDPRYPFGDSTQLTIDGCDMRKNLRTELLNSLPPDAFVRSLWVNEWNGFIHIAARNAEISWANGGSITYREGQEARS
jgi:hypothetical protein